MKIERFLYGMFDGKVELGKTDGVNDILSDKNFQKLRKLTVEDSDKYLWLPTEQVVALPHIVNVEDDDGRTFVQNETFLVKIHDYIQLTNPNSHLFKYFTIPWNSFPDRLESIQIG